MTPHRLLLPLCCATLFAPAVVGAAADGLSPVERRIVAAVDARTEPAIALLGETVDVASATENLAGVRAVAEIYAREFGALGFATRWVDAPAGSGRAGHFVAERPGRGKPAVLMIGHLDTVLEGERFRRDGSRAYGSGVADMKAGNLVALEAVRALHAAGALRNARITVVFTGDEEDPGQPVDAARATLREAARGADVALAFEGATPGKAVVGRRGIATWRLHVTGKQAHSSGIFGESRGEGAIFAAARILERFRTELRHPNLTYNPSVILGGTNVAYDADAKGGTAQGKTNVIPREVRVEGDVRYLGAAQLDEARAQMQGIVGDALPHTSATIEFTEEYPSMAPNPGSEQLLALLDAVSRALGAEPIVAQAPMERGAGDISFVCDDGRLACLDGLGALGDLDHAPGEYVELDALPLQVRRTALLLHRLLASGLPGRSRVATR